ncbi:uncharacterized protein TNCV_985211 [Trichonephila clavipes]|nr:uncharacterized protein TNCV_985211 [Trichonephila clavipes]
MPPKYSMNQTRMKQVAICLASYHVIMTSDESSPLVTIQVILSRAEMMRSTVELAPHSSNFFTNMTEETKLKLRGTTVERPRPTVPISVFVTLGDEMPEQMLRSSGQSDAMGWSTLSPGIDPVIRDMWRVWGHEQISRKVFPVTMAAPTPLANLGPLYGHLDTGSEAVVSVGTLSHVPVKEGLQSVIKCLKSQDISQISK